MLNDRRAVEIFHLLFLRTLGARVDKAIFCLKGGCNLRFFLKSTRYSEDMDLDIQTMAPGTLANNVNRVLEGESFIQSLRAQGLEITRATQPKQTPTTQRWKMTLRLLDSGTEVPTNIEFSRRDLDADRTIEPVDAELIRSYRLYPVIVQHYSVDAGGGRKGMPTRMAAHLGAAIENAMAVGYDAFAGRVLAYLEPEYQDNYGGRQAWNALQEQVVAGLEALRP